MAASVTRGGVPERRSPLWSQVFTRPLARIIPVAWRPAVVAGIKALHTGLFVGIGAAIVLFVAGLLLRPKLQAFIERVAGRKPPEEK